MGMRASVPGAHGAAGDVRGGISLVVVPTATTIPPEASLPAGKPTIYTEIRAVDQLGRTMPASVSRGPRSRGDAGLLGERAGDAGGVPRRLVRNGDLGLIDHDGYLHVLDRLKDVIYRRRLKRLASDLGPCSTTATRSARRSWSPDATTNSARCRSPASWPPPGRTLTAEHVIGLCEDRLATFKHLREVIFADALPRN